jgi:serine/threonine protein kinase
MPPEHKYSLPIGVRLRQYHIVRLLGHGGFGLTYLADDTRLDRKVAIKELLPIDFAIREVDGTTVVARSSKDSANLEWARRRFVEEGQTLAKLHHPSILPIYEIFEEHGTAYLVTAFIEGDSLEDWLRKVQRPTESDLRSITVGLLEALGRVHELGYLHRDVKPENILMDRRDGRPILIDFGNARAATGERTANLTAVLTKGYAPFEQYQTKGRQGPFTDIYALGAVLYRAIKGVAPEDAADRWEQDKVESLSLRPPPGYSREFLASVDKALKMRREDRWQNCQEWKTALGVSDQSGGQSPSPLPRHSKAPLGVVALGSLAIAAVGIGLWVAGHPSKSNPANRDLYSPAPASPSPGVVVAIPSRAPTSPSPSVVVAAPSRAPTSPSPSVVVATPSPAPATPPPVTPVLAVTPELATADHPYVNSLGMKFAPVPVRNGQKLLFCIHETRKRDYSKFAEGRPSLDNSWQNPMEKGIPVSETPEHPVVNVNLEEAKAFCAWLTDIERASGKIGSQDVCRLPTDDEWSCAVGLENMEKPEDSPIDKSRAHKDIFPWGNLFDPSSRPMGNYADESMKGKFKSALADDFYIKGYNDGYATTAPVMQFPCNPLGIFDLGGNVMEWCDTYYDKVDNYHKKPILEIRRGGSWKTDGANNFQRLTSSSRNADEPKWRETDVGFRCVLSLSAH